MPQYEIFDNYDQNATRNIELGNYVKNSLKRYERILSFIRDKRPEIFDGYVKMYIDLISGKTSSNRNEELGELYPSLLEQYPLLTETGIIESLVSFTLDLLELPADPINPEDSYTVLTVNKEKGENVPHYFAIKAFIDQLGREEGIQFYKDFVQHINNPPPHREVDSFQAFRKSAAEGMGNSGGFAFTIHDFDDSMWVGRFDKCVVYDSLKDQTDSEIGYLATCYNGLIGCNNRDWCIRMRRTQTLYSADYCDELYWDRHVHDEPEQPSLEFTKKMVID